MQNYCSKRWELFLDVPVGELVVELNRYRGKDLACTNAQI
jgi:hypothetical protein